MSLVTTLYKDHKGVFDEKLFKLSIRRVSEPSPPENRDFSPKLQ